MSDSTVLLISPYDSDYERFKTRFIKTHIYYADSASLALQLLEEYDDQIDLVVMSAKLDDIYYIELLKQLSLTRCKKTFILYSSVGVLKEIKEVFKLGVYDFVFVHSNYDLLFDSVQNFLENRFILNTGGQHSGSLSCLSKPHHSILIEVIEASGVAQHTYSKEICILYDQWVLEYIQSFKQPRLLVVEDEVPYNKMIVDFLESKYENVVGVYSGKSALDELNSTEYDVVLLDLFLPDIDGIDLIKSIHTKFDLIEKVVISAFDLIDRSVESFRAGATDFLNKPILKKDLFETVDSAFSRLIKRKMVLDSKRLFFQTLSDKHKLALFEMVLIYKKKIGVPVVMDDLYQCYPDLVDIQIPAHLSFPVHFESDAIEQFINSLRLKSLK